MNEIELLTVVFDSTSIWKTMENNESRPLMVYKMIDDELNCIQLYYYNKKI